MHSIEINNIINNFIQKSNKIIVKNNQIINQVKIFYIIYIFYKKLK